MRTAETTGNKDCPVKIKLVAATLYVLTTQTLDKEQGILVLTNAIQACKETIQRHQGKLTVTEHARTISCIFFMLIHRAYLLRSVLTWEQCLRMQNGKQLYIALRRVWKWILQD